MILSGVYTCSPRSLRRVACTARPLSETELLVRRVLSEVWPGAVVVQHDTGFRDSMFDLRVSGARSAAVEVVALPDTETRATSAAWHKRLRLPVRSSRLQRMWRFSLGQNLAGPTPGSFPRVPRGSDRRLIRVLAALEAAKIYEIGITAHQFLDAAEPDYDGPPVPPEVRALFDMIGTPAESATSYVPDEGPGGWHFRSFGFIRAGSPDPEAVVPELQKFLDADAQRDVVSKVARSGLEHRCVAIVFDTLTRAGASLGTWDADALAVPTLPLALPDGITSVVVISSPKGIVAEYDATDGWRRHHSPAAFTPQV